MSGSMSTQWIGLFFAMLASSATAVWSIVLSAQPSIDLLRCASIVAGLISGISFGVYPLQVAPTMFHSVMSGGLLVMYQGFIYASVSSGGPTMQAAINSNVVLIVLYENRNISCSLLAVAIVLCSVVLLLLVRPERVDVRGSIF